MVLAITTNDNKNISAFNSKKVLLIDTEKNTQEETNYINAIKYADVLITAHLDGFDAENITKNGVHPIKFIGTIDEAIENFKDCGLKRTLPIGDNSSCSACGI